MAPPFPSSRIELDYPLYAVQFDPDDANRFAVAGGGGAGRSGVGNKIVSPPPRSPVALRLAGRFGRPNWLTTLLCSPSSAQSPNKTSP